MSAFSVAAAVSAELCPSAPVPPVPESVPVPGIVNGSSAIPGPGDKPGSSGAVGAPSGPAVSVLSTPSNRTEAIHSRIQKTDAMMVTRVKVSPALVPNALWPPMPPRAPVNPPPRPRCTRINRIRKIAVSDSIKPKKY